MLDLTDNIINVSDIMIRVEELESERDAYPTDADTLWDQTDESRELAHLESLLDDLKGNGGDEEWRGDWYPVTLIRDSYFTEYAQELVQDIGDLPNGIPSYIEIDWEATARNIRMDYTSIDIDGETYWYR